MRSSVIYISLALSIISLVLSLIELKSSHESRLLTKEIHTKVHSIDGLNHVEA